MWSALAAGCASRGAVEVRVEPRAVPLNGRIELQFDGPVDPLTITTRSVRVERDGGGELPARLHVSRAAVAIEVVVDRDLVEDPPAALLVHLAGAPSLHAVGLVDGRRLSAPLVLRVAVAGGLSARTGAPPRLQSVGGRRLPLSGPVERSKAVTLVFDAPLDPATVRAAACPLHPVSQGLALRPVHPRVEWRCIGERFELDLMLDGEHGPLMLDLRRFDVRGLAGQAPEPPVVVQIAPG